MWLRKRFTFVGFDLLMLAMLALIAHGQVLGAQERVLWSFDAGTDDGYYPYGGLIGDMNGDLYGTTAFGGTDGSGTAFKLSPPSARGILGLNRSSGASVMAAAANIISMAA